MDTRYKIGLSGCAGGLETISTSQLLSLAEMADELGFDGLWLNEEHFQGGNPDTEGRRCLSPLLLAAAVLARTRRLRVGFSVLLVPLHHPIRLAEEIATLDVLSDGRVDFGIARSTNPRYQSVFGIPGENLDERFHHDLDLILRAWQASPLDIGNGTYSVEPKPIQRPHPPIFLGTHTESVAAWAASRGHAIICHGITNFPNLKRLVRAFADGGGDVCRVPIGRFVYVSESDDSARRELWPTVLRLTTRLQSLSVSSRTGVLTDRDLQPDVFYEEMVIAGSPATCATRIRAIRDELGSNYLNALSAFFGFLPLPYLEQSLRLLAREVRPLIDREVAGTPSSASLGRLGEAR